MLKGIKTGISITPTTEPLVEQKTVAPEQAKLQSPPTEPTVRPNVYEMKANVQMFGSLQQASLFNRLDRLPLTEKNAQKEAGTDAGVSFKDEQLNQQGHLENLNISVFEDLKKKVLTEASTPFMKSLYTGSGDDIVDISYQQSDDLVHVTVNGEEAWKGTVDQFSKLTIDTGDGKDIVTINAYGAKVVTGSGNDQVLVTGSGSLIDTGAGDDEVYVAPGEYGGRNTVLTGDGGDLVYVSGEQNKVDTGGGDDAVFVRGDQNRVSTAEGDDYIEIEGYGNKIKTGEGEDQVKNRGAFNAIDGIGPFGADNS